MLVEDLGQERIPVVLLSGIVNLRAVAMTVGTPYFVAKPYDLERVSKVIARALVERIPPTPRLPAAAIEAVRAR